MDFDTKILVGAVGFLLVLITYVLVFTGEPHVF